MKPDLPANKSTTPGPGWVTFLGTEVWVGSGVLVPRPETELIGRAALAFLDEIRATRPDDQIRVIDMCCGSGNLACALAASVADARFWATDLTDACVERSRENVVRLGFDDRIYVVQGDLFAGLEGMGLEGTIDAVVCNPPYIPTAQWEERDDLRDEPREAFDGGPYGLSILMKVIRQAPKFLRPGGGLFLEVGPREERYASNLFSRAPAYDRVEMIRTEAGVVHAISARTVE
jgi:release factor glutamine methyltransferase